VTLTPAELIALISNGESARLELKAVLPRPSQLARDISALTNVGGGLLIIGVEVSPGDGIGFRGVDDDDVKLALKRALLLLRPAPQVILEFPRLRGEVVGVISVSSVPATPVWTQGTAFTRSGDKTAPANAHQLMEMVDSDGTQSELLLHLKRFSQAIEERNKIIDDMRAEAGWKNKLFWAVMGGAIGLLFSIPLLFFQ